VMEARKRRTLAARELDVCEVVGWNELISGRAGIGARPCSTCIWAIFKFSRLHHFFGKKNLVF
jgi:hypothetical protein